MVLTGNEVDGRQEEGSDPSLGEGDEQLEQRDDGRRSHEVARGLWTELMARLTHIADELTRPETIGQLRGMGVRGIEGALTNIAREYARSNQIALATGAAPRPHEIMKRARSMALLHDLRFDYLELARTYRLLCEELDLPLTSHRHRWLEGRANLHQSQADALERKR